MISNKFPYATTVSIWAHKHKYWYLYVPHHSITTRYSRGKYMHY